MNSPSIGALAKKVQSMKDRFEKVEKDIRELKDILNVHDNWHSTIRNWIGLEVKVATRNGDVSFGTLQWSDRYNVCVVDHGRPRMFTKGGINWIEPVKAGTIRLKGGYIERA